MARVSIYVSDELKARMGEAGDALNWSDIARPAFESALADFQHRKGRSMTTAVERLKASKQVFLENTAKNGAQRGRQWAQDTASFFELRELSKIEIEAYETDPDGIVREIVMAVDPERIHRSDDMSEILFGDRMWPPEEWLVGWVKGAKEFFEEIEDQL